MQAKQIERSEKQLISGLACPQKCPHLVSGHHFMFILSIQCAQVGGIWGAGGAGLEVSWFYTHVGGTPTKNGLEPQQHAMTH